MVAAPENHESKKDLRVKLGALRIAQSWGGDMGTHLKLLGFAAEVRRNYPDLQVSVD
jgi:hypothetical protein